MQLGVCGGGGFLLPCPRAHYVQTLACFGKEIVRPPSVGNSRRQAEKPYHNNTTQVGEGWRGSIFRRTVGLVVKLSNLVCQDRKEGNTGKGGKGRR